MKPTLAFPHDGGRLPLCQVSVVNVAYITGAPRATANPMDKRETGPPSLSPETFPTIRHDSATSEGLALCDNSLLETVDCVAPLADSAPPDFVYLFPLSSSLRSLSVVTKLQVEQRQEAKPKRQRKRIRANLTVTCLTGGHSGNGWSHHVGMFVCGLALLCLPACLFLGFCLCLLFFRSKVSFLRLLPSGMPRLSILIFFFQRVSFFREVVPDGAG